MKKFFAKASKPFALPTSPDGSSGKSVDAKLFKSPPGQPSIAPGLHPGFSLPPIPHPCPHDHLALMVSEDGLIIRPHVAGSPFVNSFPYSYLRISWGKNNKIEEFEKLEKDDLDWTESVVVYGIAGMVELFTCSYLLVITSREEVGHVLDLRNKVYVIKTVLDIPLVEDRARFALNTLASRNNALNRPSLLSPKRTETDLGLDLDYVDEPLSESITSQASKEGSTRVKFLSPPSVRKSFSEILPLRNDEIGSIQRPSSALSNLSDISTPSSEASVLKSPVFTTVASRLSFWSKLSKRTTRTPTLSEFPLVPEPLSVNEEQEVLDKLMKDAKEEPAEVIGTILASTAPPPTTIEEKHSEIETKVIRECVREFTKGSMYFTYTFDITRSLQHKHELSLKLQKQRELLAGLGALDKKSDGQTRESTTVPVMEPNPALPLWRRVDKQFWWNEWMSKSFIEAGLHSYILPLMQGFCQVTRFNIPETDGTDAEDVPVHYILISRRSRNRPGLRYQRRGIDEEAHVANFVETEAIMHVEREGKQNVFAYVQVRGSIPLFWTQTGYGLKPPPMLATDRTHDQNFDALKRHFMRTIPVYGHHTAVNLAEQHGKEGVVTKAYKEFMQELNKKDAQYCEYDFHMETKGMKYENIQTLIDSMERTFETQGYFWVSDKTVFCQQKGIFRVNCIDCLDRTNVVQSAFARYVLNKQLGAVALLNSGRSDADLCFNHVWANNGDAVSRAYAGTSALKGDFTRTGKRDLTGMLNDGVNSLARMYTSTFSDWFSQAVIDFMLGNRTISVFSEFLNKLKSTDPRDLIRLSKIRAEAIATSVSRVMLEGDQLLSGWTLFSPEDINTKVGMKFEEKVLLLSAKALYIVSYDYTLEKVKSYTRVPLGDIISISKGAYILSPLEESSCDTEQNAGFIISWVCANQESRVTSYSVRNRVEPSVNVSTTRSQAPLNSSSSRPRRRSNTLPSRSNVSNSSTSLIRTSPGQVNYAAFKVLPIDPARVRRESSAMSEVYMAMSDELQTAATCREAADLIVDRVWRACEDVGGAHDERFIVQEDVVSLAEAQKMTSVYAKMEYGVKRLLWLGS